MTLDKPVILSFPSAVQAIAALEDRIAMLHHDDEAWARADCQRAVDELRQVFGIRRMTEAEMDAAHEAAHIALDEMRENDYPDVPLIHGGIYRMTGSSGFGNDATIAERVERYQAEGR